MLQQPQVEDFVISTGRTVLLQHFVERAFAHFGLHWRRHVKRDISLLRTSDIRYGTANPSHASATTSCQPGLSDDDDATAMYLAAEGASA